MAEEVEAAVAAEIKKAEKVKACPECKKSFGLLLWRHHCRQCGDIYCDNCAPAKTWERFTEKMRVCPPCRGKWGEDGDKKGKVALPGHFKTDQAKYRTKHGVNDMVLLEDVSNQGIVDCLSAHYGGDEIYTYIGQVLVSVNPFKQVSGLYSKSVLSKYKGKNYHENPPHVYAVAESAYRGMIRDLTKECVIISGESGAGKTEASKKVMEYIAAVSGKEEKAQSVKDKLLESNPLLEAFGNAKTIRNNNSSRFGKYMEIQFDIGDPVGGKILVFLLEKNRLIERQKTERCFHIFYQLLASDTKKEYKLEKPEDYLYLKRSECYTIEAVNDATEFKETTDAMKTIGLDGDSQKDIFALLAGILHLGNVEFSGDRNKSSVKNTDELDRAASCFSVTSDDLSKNLTHKEIKAGIKENITSPLGLEQAAYGRDSFSKGVYGRLFQWIVTMANKSIYSQFHSNLIGVLDIYGFEIFGVNGFEQLCINYVNERLHQLFIELTLKAEQDEYRAEGIPWEDIKYYNNLPICTLIEGRGQIFDLLNEESIFPEGTDSSLFAKMKKNIHDPNFHSTKGMEFSIRHYAGDVAYTVEGFLDKNNDPLFLNLIKMGAESKNKLLKALFEEETNKKDNKRPVTSCVQFKTQVRDLMATLRACNQHYIRCIKPNDAKRANYFDQKLVFTQVTYLGLLENVTVRRAGYAARIPFEKFLAKYKACSKNQVVAGDDRKGACEKLMKTLDFKDYVVGKTKIFIRSPKTLFALEDMRGAFLDEATSLIPKDEQLIFADRVISYDNKEKVELLFCIASQHTLLIRGDKVLFKISVQELEGMTMGDKKDGYLILHCKETLPEKELKKASPRAPAQWNVLLENVFKEELLQVVELLKTSGVTFDVRRTDMEVSAESLNSRFAPDLKGTESERGKCLVM